MLPRLVRQSWTSAQKHTTVSSGQTSYCHDHPTLHQTEPAPPTCDLLERPPKCKEKLQHRYCCSRFCNQMDQQESVQFWPGLLLVCASICKAESLSENWDGCNKFPSSSYLLCNIDGLISDSIAIWLHSPDAELNADSVELILHMLAGNCNMSISVKILFLKSSLSNDPALIKKLREFST